MRHCGPRTALPAIAALCVLLAAGCGPLVEVRATIRADDLTRLEREVLGGRGTVAPARLLLAVEPAPAETTADQQQYQQLARRLAAFPEKTPRLRAWQVVVEHNLAVLTARAGDAEAARQMLAAAAQKAEKWWLYGLLWQVELSRAELAAEDGAAHLERAVSVAAGWPPLSGMDWEFEARAALDRLYGDLIRRTLPEDPEAALSYALEREAVLLSRAVPPGGLPVREGELGRMVAEFERARAAAGEARRARCATDAGQLAPLDLSATAEGERLRAAAADLNDSSPLGGLFAPEPPDPFALREALGAEAALLDFSPAGQGAWAGFFLTADVFEARLLAADAGTPGVLLAPFEQFVGSDVRALYLALPAGLSGLDWSGAPWGGSPLTERLELAFLGGAADLLWGFRARSYGRESVLVCGGAEATQLAEAMETGGRVEQFDTRRRSKADLPGAAELVDVVWVGVPVRLMPQAPGAAYLEFPGAPGRLSGVSAGELAGYGTRAGAFCLASLPEWALERGAFPALRVLTRACIAAGASSVIYGTDAAGRTELWSAVLQGLRGGPASAAVQGAGGGVRLYGFAGLTDRQYAELSRLDFNDTLRAGQAHLQAGQFGEAAGKFLDLWHMARVLPFEDESRRQLILANIQQQLVECQRRLRAYGEAARHQRQRIAHLERRSETSPADLAVEYQSLGALLTQAERWSEAVEAYETSLALLREEGQEEQLAAVLGELGKSQDRAAHYQQALDSFEQALAIYRRLGSPEGAALQHGRMGAVYLRRLGNAPRAEEEFRRALDLYGSAGQSQQAAEARIDVALCRRHLGDFPGALELLEQARRAAEEQDMPATLARALAEEGNTRWLTGDYQRALELVPRANDIARQVGDHFQLNVNYQLLALIYWELNQYDRAYDALDVAIEAARRAEDPLEVASAHNNRGIIHRRSGQYREALESFRQALQIDERLRSRWGMGYDHRNIGMTLHRMGRLQEAEPHLEQAVELAESIGDRVNLAKALLALAELRLDQDAVDEAVVLFERALTEAREVYLPEVEWRALRGLGRLRRREGDREAAWEAFREGIAVVEQMGAGLKIDEFRSGFLVNKMDLYEDAVDLLLEMGREREAFHYAERSRARKFADVLSGRPLELRTDEERDLYRRQQDLSARIRGASQAVARESDPERKEALAADLERLRREYADLLLDMRVEHPKLSGFITVEAVTAEELPEFVPPGVALVAYYMLGERLVAWWWREGAFGSVQVPVGREELTAQIRDFRLMVQNRELLSEVRPAAQALYDHLLRPLERELARAEAVCIVPHRGLHYLSFAALHDGSRFAVERWPLFYSPSASVLRGTLGADAPAHRREVRVLALGNPDVGDAAYELPFTEREVVSIERDFPRVTALTGTEASEERLRNEIAGYDIVHIGAHGTFDSANPLFSAIVLAPQQEDGLLHLYEVPALEIHAQLLSLSACQTALGELRSADELVSLSRAFSYAGARSILSTLWRVDDVSTALVSKHFYRHYVAHGAAESLRHAQLQVMNDGRHYHPTYWAGVLLTGDYR